MKHLEDIEQENLILWAGLVSLPKSPHIEEGAKLLDYLYAIPNGGKRNAREAARFKRQGVKAGVSDLHLALPAGGKSGLWIEMKQPDKKKASVSKSQKDWINRMSLAGYEAKICYGFDEAKLAIEEYLA